MRPASVSKELSSILSEALEMAGCCGLKPVGLKSVWGEKRLVKQERCAWCEGAMQKRTNRVSRQRQDSVACNERRTAAAGRGPFSALPSERQTDT